MQREKQLFSLVKRSCTRYTVPAPAPSILCLVLCWCSAAGSLSERSMITIFSDSRSHYNKSLWKVRASTPQPFKTAFAIGPVVFLLLDWTVRKFLRLSQTHQSIQEAMIAFESFLHLDCFSFRFRSYRMSRLGQYDVFSPGIELSYFSAVHRRIIMLIFLRRTFYEQVRISQLLSEISGGSSP